MIRKVTPRSIARNADFQDEVTLYGADKSYRLDKRSLSVADTKAGWRPVEDLPYCGSSTDHFVDTIIGKSSQPGAPYADPHSEDGLRAVRVVEALHAAGQTGKQIQI